MDESSNHEPIVIVKSDAKKPSFLKRIQAPFSRFSSSNKKIAAGILTMLLVFGIGAGVYLTQRPTQLQPKATLNGVDLTLQPSSINTTQNTTFNVDLSMNTKISSASAVQVKVNYDPLKLTFVDAILSSLLPVVLQPVQIGTGTSSISFTVGSQPNNPFHGTGNIATLKFRALTNTGSTQVTFDPQITQVAVVGQDSNWVENLNPTTINFGTIESSPSASPSPTTSSPPIGTSTSFELRLPAGNATPNVGQQFKVDIFARSDVETSNLFVAKLAFPKDKLEVVSITPAEDTFVNNWTEEYFDNVTGTASIIGGIPNPGFKSTNQAKYMTSINFRAKASGDATISFLNESQIFSNATNQNILLSKTGTSVTIIGGITASPSPSTAASPSPQVSPSPLPSPSPSQPVGCGQKGDGNSDCIVNLQDLSVLLTHFSATAIRPIEKANLDFNDDQRINVFDFSALSDKLFQLGVIRRRS